MYGTTDSGQVKRWLIAIIVGGGVHTDLQFGRARGDRVGESIVVRDLKVSSAF